MSAACEPVVTSIMSSGATVTVGGPLVVPEGMTNLGLLGQYVEVERDITFTFEYSTRTAFEAIRQLKGGPPPPPVYRGQCDPGGVWKATKVFLGLTKT